MQDLETRIQLTDLPHLRQDAVERWYRNDMLPAGSPRITSGGCFQHWDRHPHSRSYRRLTHPRAAMQSVVQTQRCLTAWRHVCRLHSPCRINHGAGPASAGAAAGSGGPTGIRVWGGRG